MSQSTPLISLARKLLEEIETVRPLPGLLETGDGSDLRDTLLLYLKMKVLPELCADKELPIFVAVQGGANVGKSTVFNALAGKLLSPSIVQASATKHPLVFLHERWRKRFLEDRLFEALACEELSDPKQLLVDAENTEVVYFRFHNDDSISNLAFIDSPDFDSALVTNLEVARRITALSDITLFVTTAQKYKDRGLVQRLANLKDLKVSILLIFNMVNEDIVFETLADDLEETLPLKANNITTFRLPSATGQHPEEELRDTLRAKVLDLLSGQDPGEVKPRTLHNTVSHVIQGTERLGQRFEPELRFKSHLKDKIEEALEREVATYRASFDLAFPEETLAIRRLVRLTEIGPRLTLPEAVEQSSKALKLVGTGMKRFNDWTRDFLVRLSRNTEGSIEETPTAIADYAKTRNDSDFESVLRRAESLELVLGTFCRSNEEGSPLARATVAQFFTPERTTHFREQVLKEYESTTAQRTESGEEILTELETWEKQHPFQRSLLFCGANILKIGSGVLLAYVLPSDGLFSLWNWLFFALGYFLAAYLIALTISLLLRRKKRFRQARTASMRAVLERVLAYPLVRAVDQLLSRDEVSRIAKTSRAIQEHPQFQGVTERA